MILVTQLLVMVAPSLVYRSSRLGHSQSFHLSISFQNPSVCTRGIWLILPAKGALWRWTSLSVKLPGSFWVVGKLKIQETLAGLVCSSRNNGIIPMADFRQTWYSPNSVIVEAKSNSKKINTLLWISQKQGTNKVRLVRLKWTINLQCPDRTASQ